ncbi:transposase [Flavobacterium sp. 1]|uniref:transposase n=1 Tax=Flavobacterium sp. 1 TaxID=2035200 RepID=UPI000C2390BA
MALAFLPPYSPELSPSELVWFNIKRKLTNKIFKTMDDLKFELNQIVKTMITKSFTKNLCGFSYFHV